ncbi:hypothetical protein A1O3_08514 [Capronia epimyces CBS 606.96]|uniref:Uncharacterized protein n=1 Tax=Capronia epimyces CBS 606.96 TaxID=1182542 RepID=W9XFL9_9EURO|nr:uncharacterized protein A1O3_08514 [Capronia epimyces CBS 606.96]EXJ79013.1 hypothetical protein A1O3_08514 [Capronia epimyces CBS 606.96]
MGDNSKHTNSETFHRLAEASTVQESLPTKLQRPLSVYDVVAGRAGQNGFLTRQQTQSQNILPLAPEDVLLRKTSIPAKFILESYDAAADLPSAVKLPESELLKAVHTYVSDFYSTTTPDGGTYDFRSLDETALIAVGILLEEAVREALGESGDMVFVEPEGLDAALEESKMTKHQVQGKVTPVIRPKDTSDEESVQENDESPAKRRRH